VSPGSLTVVKGTPGDRLYYTLNGPEKGDKINYRWEKSTNYGVSFTPIAGAAGTDQDRGTVVSYTLVGGDVAETGQTLYRVKAWYGDNENAAPAYSAPGATVVVIPEAAKTVTMTGPRNVSYKAGEPGKTLTVTIEGPAGAIKYQWEKYTGGAWVEISGYGTSGDTGPGKLVTYTPADTLAGTYYYRLRVWYEGTTAYVYSDTAEVEVLPPDTVTQSSVGDGGESGVVDLHHRGGSACPDGDGDRIEFF